MGNNNVEERVRASELAECWYIHGGDTVLDLQVHVILYALLKCLTFLCLSESEVLP